MGMKYITFLAIFVALLFGGYTYINQSPNVGGGLGTIEQLGLWFFDGTNITQNTASTTIKLTGYESAGDCLITDSNGVVSTATCGTGGGSNWSIIPGGLRTSTTTDFAQASYLVASSTTATSTLPNTLMNRLQAISSAGLDFFSNNGTAVADFGAGGGSNATFFGGVNIDGATRLATSLTGLLQSSSGVVSATATGTLTETVSGLQFDATRGVVGGSAILSLTSGFEVPLTASTTNWNSFYNVPSTRISDGTGLTWSSNTLNCDTASGSVQGCLASTDWTVFNNKISSTSLSVTDSTTIDLGYTSATGVFTSSVIADSIGDTQLAFNTGQNLTTASSPSFTGLTVGSATGVVTRTSGVLGTGVDGTDFTLINAITCSNQFLISFTAAGVGTCGSVSTSTLTAPGYTAGYILQASTTASGGWAWVATSTLGFSGSGGGGSTNTYFNSLYRDQAGGTSDTYGALGGTRNGSNQVFTVSQGTYRTGTLKVSKNGQLLTQGSSEDWVETSTSTGTFTLAIAPSADDELTAEYETQLLSANTVCLSTACASSTTLGYAAGYVLQASTTMANGMRWVATSTLGISGGSSNWTDAGLYLAPLTATDGILLTGSSTINALSSVYATTTELNIGANKIKQHNLGFLDFQRTGADYTLARIRAPKGDSNEATLSLVVDLSSTDTGVDEEFVDFYNERYEDSLQWGLRQAYSGTGIAKPFAIGHWDVLGNKDAGNKLIIMPSGAVAVARATSTIPTNTALYVASSTATNLLQLDATPGTTRLFVTAAGALTVTGTSTLATTTIPSLQATTTALKITSLRDNSSSLGTVGQVLQSNGSTAQWVSTSSLNISGGGGFSDPLTTNGDIIARIAGSTTRLPQGANGTFLGVSGGTLGYYTPAGSGTINSGTTGQFPYYSGVGTTLSATSSLFVATDGKIGIGTTTPNDALTIAVGNNAGMEVLSTNSGFLGYGKVGADRWRMQNEFTNVGLFEILYNNGAGGPAGTSLLTLTGTGSGIAGRVGIGTQAPTANLSVFSNIASGTIATFHSSTGTTSLAVIHATSTVRHLSNLTGFLQSSRARIAIGLEAAAGYLGSTKFFDALTINGTIRQQGWNQVDCSSVVGAIAISADALTGCDGFTFMEDGTATLTSTANGGSVYGRMSTSAVNDGAGVFLNAPTAGFLLFATSTPIFEATVRINAVQNYATTTQAFIGFSNIASAGTTYETAPTAGCYFTASSTQNNWQAMCRTSAAANTIVDTGIASTTVTTGDSVPYTFLIEADNDGAKFFIRQSEANTLNQVAYITTNVPTSTAMNAGVHLGRISGVLAIGLDIYNMNVAWRNPLAR